MAGIAAWLPLLGMPARGWLDFSAFYAAGALAFGPEVMDLGATAAYQYANGLPNTPFLYPPALAIAYAPLAELPYDLAAALHVAVQAVALLAAAALASGVYGIPRRWAFLGTLAWAPAAAAVVSGQNSAGLLLLIVGASWAVGRSPAGSTPIRNHWLAGLAGFVIGLAVYRPHMGLPVLGLIVWRRAWSAAGMAVAVVAIHYGLGLAATGGALDWPARWLSNVLAATANDFESVGWQVIGLPGMLGRISVGGSAPGAVIGPALIGYAIGLVAILSALGPLRRWDAKRAIALTCALALFAGPRGFAYDGTMLLPAIAILVRDGAERGWPWTYRWMLASAYGIALSWPLGGLLGVNPLAIVVLAAPFILLGRGPFRAFAPPDVAARTVGILGRP